MYERKIAATANWGKKRPKAAGFRAPGHNEGKLPGGCKVGKAKEIYQQVRKLSRRTPTHHFAGKDIRNRLRLAQAAS